MARFRALLIFLFSRRFSVRSAPEPLYSSERPAKVSRILSFTDAGTASSSSESARVLKLDEHVEKLETHISNQDEHVQKLETHISNQDETIAEMKSEYNTFKLFVSEQFSSFKAITRASLIGTNSNNSRYISVFNIQIFMAFGYNF